MIPDNWREENGVMVPVFRLHRWAERKNNVVEWGNIVGGFCGQEFKETFATEEEAKERERQALANEGIGDNREPIAIERIAKRP